MSTENEERLDDLFKKKLEDPVDEIRFEERDWDALEQMMDKPKRKGVTFLWPILSGVAAMLLLFFGWWAFRGKTDSQATKSQVQIAARHKTTDTIIEKQAKAASKATDTIMNRQATTHSKATDTIIERRAVQQSLAHQKSVPGLSVGKSGRDTIIEKAIANGKPGNRMNTDLVAVNSSPVLSAGSLTGQTVKQIYLPILAYSPTLGLSTAKNNIKAKSKGAFHPQYALSVVAAPDLNGVGSFQQSKVGTNIGMTFAVGISRKITVSTGALYSVKPYMTNFNNYNTGSNYKWAVDPLNVTADCRMLDIPLNVGYQIYHKRQDKISVGTGLSSYLMLHESYKFNYQYDGPKGPSDYTVPNPGKYFLGVMNLNATYERQINSKVGISIQPYMKLPLTEIGYSQVKLQTTGVAVGLSWNLNSLTKP